MELEIERERLTNPVVNGRGSGLDISGGHPIFTGSQIRNALRLIEVGESATQVARGLEMSRPARGRGIRELAVPAV